MTRWLFLISGFRLISYVNSSVQIDLVFYITRILKCKIRKDYKLSRLVKLTHVCPTSYIFCQVLGYDPIYDTRRGHKLHCLSKYLYIVFWAAIHIRATLCKATFRQTMRRGWVVWQRIFYSVAYHSHIMNSVACYDFWVFLHPPVK